MALPFLPGNSFSTALGKDKFHKSHHFDCKNEVAFRFGDDKPGIGGEFLAGQTQRPPYSNYPRGEGPDLPSWVAFDRQVLCFDAYFQEAVHEKREEQYRVRNCKIYFYLEDDSIQVIEPRLKNSGIPQGTLVRRHRIPRPVPHDDLYYRVEDFNIGEEINLYSKVFKLTGADEFTMNFLGKLGVRVGGKDASPGDPYMKYRKALDESMQPLRPYEKHDTLKQFLDHDRHVLRFYCHWDDTDSMFGDSRDMVMHYFLADDTLEIREIIPANSGRDAAPLFLRRSKLPKVIESLKQPGVATDRTVLNVFGPTGHGGRYILDSLKTGAVHSEFITDADLSIGNYVNVWGRNFQICEADDFTKEYYKTKYGIESFSPVKSTGGTTSRERSEVAPYNGFGSEVAPYNGFGSEVAPYNGFGSEEDSMCSCLGLIPKPPRRDFIKFMEKDRHGLESNVLRFLARMDTTKPIDKDRRFIISYFMSDDTVLVFEPPIRNSGVLGGKFLERGRIKKANQPRYSTDNSEYYTVNDLFVGAEVDFNCHKFILIDADEYAFMYMEKHFEKFPVADINAVLRKLAPKARENSQEVRQHVANNDPESCGYIQYEQFHRLVTKLAGSRLREHEIMTVARYYSDLEENKPVELGVAVNVIQDHLRKHNFTEFSQLSQYFLHYDQARRQELPVDDVRRILRAQKVPIPNDAVTTVLSSLEENGLVKYDVLLYHLNWRDFPATPVHTAIKVDTEWTGNTPSNQVHRVRYQDLINDLVGNATE